MPRIKESRRLTQPNGTDGALRFVLLLVGRRRFPHLLLVGFVEFGVGAPLLGGLCL